MPVNIACNKCKKIEMAYINPKNDKVFCDKCNSEHVNVNHFIKQQLKQLKQYKVEKQIPFATKCDLCQAKDRPLLNGDDIICNGCKKVMNLPEPIKIMLKLYLKNDLKNDHDD